MLDKPSTRPADFGNQPQRLAAVAGVPDLLAEFGVPLTALLDGLPIDPSIFASPDNRLPYGLVSHILERCAALTGCSHFGLRLGERFDHRCMGAAGLWMRNAPTLEAVLTGFVALQPTATRGAAAYLHRQHDHVVLGYGAYERSLVAHTQVYFLVMTVGFNLIRALTGGRARPVEVLFATRPPDDPSPFRKYFGVPVRFDQPENGLVLTPASLRSPIVGANKLDFEALRQRAAAAMPPSEAVWSDHVRRALRTALLRGEITAPRVAASLEMHPKTLMRRLAAEGSSFQALLAEARFRLARELLEITGLPVGDIALALGYATQSAFGHAFKAWSGTTPSQWRADRVRGVDGDAATPP